VASGGRAGASNNGGDASVARHPSRLGRNGGGDGSRRLHQRCGGAKSDQEASADKGPAPATVEVLAAASLEDLLTELSRSMSRSTPQTG